jgi:hypothetical protein
VEWKQTTLSKGLSLRSSIVARRMITIRVSVEGVCMRIKNPIHHLVLGDSGFKEGEKRRREVIKRKDHHLYWMIQEKSSRLILSRTYDYDPMVIYRSL